MMATYDYKCAGCDITTTINHPIDQTPVIHCHGCGKPMAKSYSAPMVTFKGTGWGKDR